MIYFNENFSTQTLSIIFLNSVNYFAFCITYDLREQGLSVIVWVYYQFH